MGQPPAAEAKAMGGAICWCVFCRNRICVKQKQKQANRQTYETTSRVWVVWCVCSQAYLWCLSSSGDVCVSECAFVCMCATVRCSLVTNWFGMQMDWCVGVNWWVWTSLLWWCLMSMWMDVLILRLCYIHILDYNLCCVVILQIRSTCWRVRLSRTARVVVCVSLSLMSLSLCLSVVQLSVCEHRMYHFSFSHFRFHFSLSSLLLIHFSFSFFLSLSLALSLSSSPSLLSLSFSPSLFLSFFRFFLMGKRKACV